MATIIGVVVVVAAIATTTIIIGNNGTHPMAMPRKGWKMTWHVGGMRFIFFFLVVFTVGGPWCQMGGRLGLVVVVMVRLFPFGRWRSRHSSRVARPLVVVGRSIVGGIVGGIGSSRMFFVSLSFAARGGSSRFPPRAGGWWKQHDGVGPILLRRRSTFQQRWRSRMQRGGRPSHHGGGHGVRRMMKRGGKGGDFVRKGSLPTGRRGMMMADAIVIVTGVVVVAVPPPVGAAAAISVGMDRSLHRRIQPQGGRRRRSHFATPIFGRHHHSHHVRRATVVRQQQFLGRRQRFGPVRSKTKGGQSFPRQHLAGCELLRGSFRIVIILGGGGQ
mmetsp:Transcript_13883/g.38403  ORF Transcript_13883/g.38403 Transcript_13883/m.38403 type:complete len:329 (+) Transcript_13883:3897-4883(+)